MEAPPPPPLRAHPPVTRHAPPPVPAVTRPTPSVQRAPPASFQRPMQQPLPGNTGNINPYATSQSASSTASSTKSMHRPTPVSTVANAAVDLSVDDPMAEPEVLDLVTPTSNVSSPPDVAASRPRPSQESSMSQETSTSSRVTHTIGDTEPLSFSELKALIARLQTDPQVYRKYEHKIFVVPCKMMGHHQYFNIDKKKKKKRDRKNKDDKVRTIERDAFYDEECLER